MNQESNNVSKSRKGNSFTFDSPAPGIHIYRNIFPESMSFMNELESEGKFDREDFHDEKYGKRASSVWLENNDIILEAFEEVTDSYCLLWGITPMMRENFRVTKFEHGEFFALHSDDSYSTPRTVSLVYYPNDDYEGGEIEFVHFNLKIKPKAGDLFIFPSAYPYKHKIHKVVSGNPRYTIVVFGSNMTNEERMVRSKKTKPPFVSELNYFLRK